MEDGRRRVRVFARDLRAAKNKARLLKNLKVNSGTLVNSAEVEEGGMKEYSFRLKDV